MSLSSRHLVYSPALDGLRALAVLAVMLYHGGVAVTGGGFLGVDIFFVLSGFLITTLLLLEFEASDRLDLKAFWGRRARRLLPALFLVLVVVLVYAAFLSGEVASSVRRDVAATIFYVSNWWFIASGNSYFDQFQDPSPLTHTWSLAIEEQWYLLLPLALVLVLPRMRSRRSLAVAFGALAVASAALMLILSSRSVDPSREYYGTDTRLQALLVGAVLACVFTPGAMERVRVAARVAAPAALIAVLVLIVAVSDTDQWMYRGGFLLVAVVTALLVGSVVVQPEGFVARGLSIAPVVWIGRISYGLYLWHWPVYVVLSPTRLGFSGTGLLVLRLTVTFGLAALSYYLVEMPIRRGSLRRFSPGRRVALAVGAPVVILGLLAVTAAASPAPAPDSLEAIRDSVTRSPDPAAITSLAETTPVTPVENLRALLLGDSVALSLYAAFQQGSIEGLTVLPGTEFGCGLVPYRAAVNGAAMPPIRPECATWEKERAARIAAGGANLGVLFAGPWEMYDRWIDGRPVPFTDPEWKEATVNAYARVLAELTPVTPRQAVVLNSCHGAPDLDLPDAALFQAGRLPDVVNDPRRVDAVNQAVKEAVRRSGRDIPVIDPNPFLCEGDQYRAQIDAVTMHTDGIHFTEEGARLYWDWLGPRLLKAGRSEPATQLSPGP